MLTLMAFEMNLILAVIFLAVGLVLLWKCAGLMVTGAVRLADRLGVSPLIIGLTIVAMGTSAPEAAAGIAAALRGAGDIAIGNVYGSNIANLALVGGLCALIHPIYVQRQTLRRHMPVMLIAALLLLPVLYDTYLSRPESIALLAIFVALIGLTIFAARKDTPSATETTKHIQHNTKKNVLFIIIGLAGLALGADMAVRGAVFIGQRIGLSKAVIGLTIIAIGTSLPELATSLVAAIKGHRDISIGNLVGSNIFNALLVVGAAGSVRPFNISKRLIGIDYWIMIIISAAFVLFAGVSKKISRSGGAILLLIYISYIVYLLKF